MLFHAAMIREEIFIAMSDNFSMSQVFSQYAVLSPQFRGRYVQQLQP